MSSILYLSDIGCTEFFNPRQEEVTYQVYRVSSQVGKMIMFPSHILHSVIPHGKKKPQERVIISSNWRVEIINATDTK